MMTSVMTRDDHRAQCIEAMIVAFRKVGGRLPYSAEQFAEEAAEYREYMIYVFSAIFDALHDIARVVPPEAMREMIYIGELAQADGADAARIFACTARVGDLTNPDEDKP